MPKGKRTLAYSNWKKDPFISLHSVDPQARLLWGGEFKPQSLNNPQTQHQWRGDADLYTRMHTRLFIYLNIYLFISGAVQQREGG